MASILSTTIEAFRGGAELDGRDAVLFLDALIAEENEPLLAEIFTIWDQKGITENEIYFSGKNNA
jgi:hypothetical protein